MLLLISPISFKNWTPTSGSLNRNARNNLLTTLLAPSVARSNVEEGTYSLELRRVSITEVTHIFAIGIINIQFLSEREKKFQTHNSTALRAKTNGILTSSAKMTKCNAQPGAERGNTMNNSKG